MRPVLVARPGMVELEVRAVREVGKAQTAAPPVPAPAYVGGGSGNSGWLSKSGALTDA